MKKQTLLIDKEKLKLLIAELQLLLHDKRIFAVSIPTEKGEEIIIRRIK